MPERASRQPGVGGRPAGGRSARQAIWITAFKGGPASYGDFLLAGPISDAVNLPPISLRSAVGTFRGQVYDLTNTAVPLVDYGATDPNYDPSGASHVSGATGVIIANNAKETVALPRGRQRGRGHPNPHYKPPEQPEPDVSELDGRHYWHR